MRARLAAALGAIPAILAACATIAPGPAASPHLALANPGFEQAPFSESCARGWNCSMHADPNSFRFFLDASQPASGLRSLCIEPVKHEPWGEATQAIVDPALAGKRLRFSVAVRTEGVATGRGAGPIIVAHGGTGQVLAVRERLVKGSRGWERLAVELDVPPSGVHDVEVGVMLDGTGRACLDDAVLEAIR